MPGARPNQGKGMACRSGHGRSPPITQAEGQVWWGLHPSLSTGRDGSRAHPRRRGTKSSECPRPREEPSSLGFPGGVSVLSSRERGLPRSCRHGGSDWRHPRQQSGALRKALWRKAMKDPRLKHRGSRGGGRPETFARPVPRASGERSVGRRTPRHDRALSPLLACVPVVGMAR